MVDTSARPSNELLSLLGVRVVERIGGRQNIHWLVESKGGPLVLRRWSDQDRGSIEYECRLTVCLKEMGWPVAVLDAPIDFDESLWSLSPFLPGKPRLVRDLDEQRALGRLLAEFHLASSQIGNFGQRPGWRRFDEMLTDPNLDLILSQNEAERSQEVRIVRWHLERARRRMEDIPSGKHPGIVVHGDFAPWNLYFEAEELTGLLDFELARIDHRVSDFALSWRGRYDAVIRAYHEVLPLEPDEWAAIVPAWWATLIDVACRDMQAGRKDDGWTVTKMLARSPLMGPDAEEMPP